MTILFVCEFYPHSLMPIGGSFFHNFAKGLVKLGHRVEVCHFKEIGFQEIKKLKGFYFKKQEIIDGVSINIRFVPKIPKLSWVNDWRVFRLLKKFIIQLHQKTPIDVVHVHFAETKAARMGAQIAHELNLPVVVTEQSTGFLTPVEFEKTLKSALKTFQYADSITVVSEKLKTVLHPHCEKEIEIINNGVDPNLFKPADTKNESKKFISVGFLQKKKNFSALIEAFAKFSDEFNGYTLEIIGDGPERQNLQALIDDLHVGHNVKLVGLKSNDEVALRMREADYFVLPSLTETFGVVVLEALFSGLPVLVTKCGGPERFVRSEIDGLIVNPYPDDLLYGLKNLVSRTWKIDRDYLLKHYSLQAVGRQLEKIYHKVINHELRYPL